MKWPFANAIAIKFLDKMISSIQNINLLVDLTTECNLRKVRKHI